MRHRVRRARRWSARCRGVQLGAGLALDELEVGVALAEERERDVVVLQGQAFRHGRGRSARAAQASTVSDNEKQIARAGARFNATRWS